MNTAARLTRLERAAKVKLTGKAAGIVAFLRTGDETKIPNDSTLDDLADAARGVRLEGGALPGLARVQKALGKGRTETLDEMESRRSALLTFEAEYGADNQPGPTAGDKLLNRLGLRHFLTVEYVDTKKGD